MQAAGPVHWWPQLPGNHMALVTHLGMSGKKTPNKAPEHWNWVEGPTAKAPSAVSSALSPNFENRMAPLLPRQACCAFPEPAE